MALTSTVKRLEDTCKKQASALKTLSFNVSGHAEDGEDSPLPTARAVATEEEKKEDGDTKKGHPRAKRKSVVEEISNEVDEELKSLELESQKKLEEERLHVQKMKETAQKAAIMMRKQSTIKNLAKEKEEQRIKEVQEKVDAHTAEIKARSENFETRAKEEMAKSKKEMEDMLNKMQAEFARKDKEQEEEKERMRIEGEKKMEAMENAMLEAKKAAEESAKIVKDKKEQGKKHHNHHHSPLNTY